MRIRLVLTVMENIFLALHPSIQRTSMSTSYYFLHRTEAFSEPLHLVTCTGLVVRLIIERHHGYLFAFSSTRGQVIVRQASFVNAFYFVLFLRVGMYVDIRGQLFQSVRSSVFICALGIKLKVPCASSASAHWAILPALRVTVRWQTWEENKKELLGLCPVNLFSLEFLGGHVFVSLLFLWLLCLLEQCWLFLFRSTFLFWKGWVCIVIEKGESPFVINNSTLPGILA